jgi:predicted DNA-binding protein (UPF0278 family)
MSIIKTIRDVLEQDGETDVFFPSQHKGECLKEYIVVKADGTITEAVVSSERPIYTVLCYVPENQYSRLETFVAETKQKMKEVFPLVMYIGNETPSFYDDDVKGHMISFQYQGCRKLKNW